MKVKSIANYKSGKPKASVHTDANKVALSGHLTETCVIQSDKVSLLELYRRALTIGLVMSSNERDE